MTRRQAAGAGRVAVLGGTGWVGRHVCRAFSRAGHEVLVVARRPAEHCAPHPFVALDLADVPAGELRRLLADAGVGVVVNATDAANAADGWAVGEQALAALNVDLVERLVAAAGALPWRTRLVHLGSILEYGETPHGTRVDEQYPPRPATAYTRSKLAGSTAVLDAARAGTVDGTVLRLTNVCGPHPSPQSLPGKLVELLAQAVRSGGPMTVGVTDARRDFVDVRDVAEAVLRAAGPGATGRAVNIGSGRAVAIRELVRLFVTAAGSDPGILREERRHNTSLGGTWTCADIRLAGELLGWRPRTDLAASLRDMWRTAARTPGGGRG
ncbi:NAD(P)-dependent oxidoreductase [Streptomyces mutabilis]|uniref:NAD-dependent epimerase/dehydratase family protein n=1 Tax=Streptomyces mutabilis TaxID=67332 RepID=UPI0022BA5EA7|nr:NAD(P)-dependent oxidoreductase [Streptomyces mutabilis]MCZ9353793.1 NAD(P)-dependent oxidoreductase [Streptomyces mutabilis]